MIDSWISQTTSQLAAAGIATARLDALILLEDCLGQDRAYLLAHPELELSPEHISALSQLIQRRIGHEPLAYIRGHVEFYGREFLVNNTVLVPRPESEAIIDLLKQIVAADTATGAEIPPSACTIIDVGTGSGALAITAELELARIAANDATIAVIGLDIDPACLSVARDNVLRLHARVQLMEGNMLEPLLGSASGSGITPTILLCNLPYVPTSYDINRAAQAEPRLAIYGGSDGLDLYRRLFDQIDESPGKPRYILAESLPMQHLQLAILAQAHGWILNTTADFVQVYTPE